MEKNQWVVGRVARGFLCLYLRPIWRRRKLIGNSSALQRKLSHLLPDRFVGVRMLREGTAVKQTTE